MRLVKLMPTAAFFLFTHAHAQGGEIRFFGVITQPTCAINNTIVGEPVIITYNAIDSTEIENATSTKTVTLGPGMARTTVERKVQDDRTVGAILLTEYL